jgi:putative membrane protein insertion efficiency factor
MKITQLPKQAVLGLIKFYQQFFSPDHSWLKGLRPYGFCRHFPSCSEYTRQAVEKHGLMRGFLLGVKRVVRCNPFAEPTVDLPK